MNEILKLTYEPLRLYPGKGNDIALSLCLYKSPQFNPDKHLTPLVRFLNEKRHGDHKDTDVLIFVEPGFDVSMLPHISGVSLYTMTSEAPGYYKHLWRYTASAAEFSRYRIIRFRGSDTPAISSDDRETEIMGEAIAAQCISGLRKGEDYQGMLGRCTLRAEARASLFRYITAQPITRPGFWTVDEMILCNWFNTHGHEMPAVMLVPNVWDEVRRHWLRNRLEQPQKTVIYRVGTKSPIYSNNEHQRAAACEVMGFNEDRETLCPAKSAAFLKVTHGEQIGYPFEELLKIVDQHWGEDQGATFSMDDKEPHTIWIRKEAE